DLDRLAVRRERLELAGLISLMVVGIGTYVATHDPVQSLQKPWMMVKFGVIATLLASSVIFILRRRLLQNSYGRRLAAIFVAPSFAWLGHRLIAQRFGTPALHVLTVDLVLLATVFGTAGIAFEPWMGWIAVLALGGAAVGAARPELSPTVVMVVILVSIAIG